MPGASINRCIPDDELGLETSYTTCAGRRRPSYKSCSDIAVRMMTEAEAYCFTELAGNAALLSCGISPQHVLPSEARADLSLLKGVVDLQSQPCGKSREGWVLQRDG